ncbi:hypothetical protein H6F67_06800 [Microcoleus sp. FACHB-1515]|uniref:hypothetical protein n=1 Tax=Cyanophyceae TaxID=3028117 RepID=UPI001682B748|nr:hypothetical protein [Microcoleus sp. FACHB-1515]MBD2089559.1 hypothetical protein [Microcoleus sp. FACHB-1515]
MKREVVQDFLNLPGIAGVALMDGRSRPFFCGLDQILSLPQREMLAQGIHQVMITTPANFERFEFQFVRYQVHLYKLAHGLVLLILASVEFDAVHHAQIERLKLELQDFASAIATFRLLSGTITLSEQRYPKRLTEAAIDPADLVNALNQMSQLASRYLGATVSSNYWKATRPTEQELAAFEVDRTACIQFTGASTRINAKTQQQIQVWAATFVDRGTKIIRDFPILIQHNLDPQSYHLLFSPETQKDSL